MKKQTRPIEVYAGPKQALLVESRHADDFEMPIQSDPFHKILYIVQGVVRYENETEGFKRIVESNQVIVVPSHVKHRLIDVKTATILILGLGGQYFSNWPDMDSIWRRILEVKRGHLILNLETRRILEQNFRVIMLNQTMTDEAARAKVRVGVANIVLEVSSINKVSTSKPRTKTSKMKDFVRILDTKFWEPWSIDDAAMQVGLSRRSFTHCFKEVTGQTFVAYLTECRLNHATTLLRSSNSSVTAAAFLCGFEDLSHFYRCFKKRFGTTPGNWKEALKE